ncbi:hypothetical protein SEA_PHRODOBAGGINS_67 [Mycobacterium phage PhrodoBaggins]|nr:hypothetical protein SEA_PHRODOBAGGINS_67 [Mycobacterium phage PhrodoBaggins]
MKTRNRLNAMSTALTCRTRKSASGRYFARGTSARPTELPSDTQCVARYTFIGYGPTHGNENVTGETRYGPR